MYQQGAKLFEGIDDEKAMCLYKEAGNHEKALALCEKLALSAKTGFEGFEFWKAEDLAKKVGQTEKAAIYGLVR